MSTLEITIDDLLQDAAKYRAQRARGEITEYVDFYLKGFDFAIWLVTAAFERIKLEHLQREAQAACDFLEASTTHRIVIDDFTRTAKVVSE